MADEAPFDSDPNVVLLRHWLTNSRRSQIANYEAAALFLRRNYWLGIPTIILSAIVGTSVFATLESSVVGTLKILIGTISIAAAVLAALQTFLRWGELAAKCRATAAEYGAIKREIEQLLSARGLGASVGDDSITRIREHMDTLSRDAPDLPAKVWTKARQVVPLAHSDR